jgi:hypothetical protein
MSELYTLFFGKSKKKMKPIMVDSYKKCENYCLARSNVIGFHKIEKGGITRWKQKTCTIGGNRAESVSRVGKCMPGFVSKSGFHPHT